MLNEFDLGELKSAVRVAFDGKTLLALQSDLAAAKIEISDFEEVLNYYRLTPSNAANSRNVQRYLSLYSQASTEQRIELQKEWIEAAKRLTANN